MYCIPIGVEQIAKTDTTELLQVWALLERNGTHCISVPSVEAALAFAAENEIPLRAGETPYMVDDRLVFLPVDLGQTEALASFYSWKEVAPQEQPMREVWRPFVWNRSPSDRDEWGTNQYLGEIEIGDKGLTVASMLSIYFAKEVVPQA